MDKKNKGVRPPHHESVVLARKIFEAGNSHTKDDSLDVISSARLIDKLIESRCECVTARKIINDRIDQRVNELHDSGEEEFDEIPVFPEDGELHRHEQSIILSELRYLLTKL